MATKNGKRLAKPAFTAALTNEQMHQAEVNAQEMGMARRQAFAALTRTADQLLESLDEESAEALLDGVENITSYLKWREDESKLLEAAQARLLAVLQFKFSPEAGAR